MAPNPDTAIDASSLEIARQLDLAMGRYATDGALLVGLLDALLRRGWEPRISYNAAVGEWHCGLARDGTYHQSLGRTVTMAVVAAAVDALRYGRR